MSKNIANVSPVNKDPNIESPKHEPLFVETLGNTVSCYNTLSDKTGLPTINSLINNPPIEDLNVIVYEIQLIEQTAQQFGFLHYIAVGHRLVLAKQLVEHGMWSRWLFENFGYSQRTANYCMRLYRKFGIKQFNTISNMCANLSHSKAIRLLPVPDEQFEDFIARHNISNMTVREIEAVVKKEFPAKKKSQEKRREVSLENPAGVTVYNTSVNAGAKVLVSEDAQGVTSKNSELVRNFKQLSNRTIGSVADMVRYISNAPDNMRADLKHILKETGETITAKIAEIT